MCIWCDRESSVLLSIGVAFRAAASREAVILDIFSQELLNSFPEVIAVIYVRFLITARDFQSWGSIWFITVYFYAIISGERVEVAAVAGAGIASHGVVAVPDVLTLTILVTLTLIDIIAVDDSIAFKS
jgi:hypothetical protein